MKNLLWFVAFFICQCKTTVSGKIVSPEGDSLVFSEGKINISSLSHKSFSEVVDIRSDGSFESHHDISPGDYLVEPLIPGFQSTSMKVSIQSDKELTIYARPTSSSSQHMIGTNHNFKEDLGSGDAVINPPKF